MPFPTIARLDFVALDHDPAGAVALHFRARKPLAYRARQHGLWFVPGGGAKPFTIASAPEEEVVTLGTSLASGSRFKRALAALAPGDTIRLFAPLARFTLDGVGHEVVLLAQGLGVTPFRAILRHAALRGLATQITLVHVGKEHAFRADTAVATAAHYPASREEFARQVAAIAAAQPGATYFISGASGFVRDTAALLRERGIAPAQIRRDTFFGIADDRARSGLALA